jgi:hypothetical protein
LPTTDLPADNSTVKDWRSLVNEYHEIICRQYNGVSTTTDKVRQAELTKNFTRLETELPQSERSDFIAEKAKAIQTEGCK